MTFAASNRQILNDTSWSEISELPFSLYPYNYKEAKNPLVGVKEGKVKQGDRNNQLFRWLNVDNFDSTYLLLTYQLCCETEPPPLENHELSKDLVNIPNRDNDDDNPIQSEAYGELCFNSISEASKTRYRSKDKWPSSKTYTYLEQFVGKEKALPFLREKVEKDIWPVPSTRFINFNNGVLTEISNKPVLVPHQHTFYARATVDCDYDPECALSAEETRFLLDLCYEDVYQLNILRMIIY